jgi:phage terminase large subunit
MASLNPTLQDFWFDGDPCPENFIKVRNRVLYGGRMSSKSWEFAGMAQSIGAQYKTRFLCVRRFQSKIKDSVYTLINAQINNFRTPGYTSLINEIRHANGSDFAFFGIERNTDEIKSFEGADILWIEEAHNLTKEQWEILEPTIRKEGSEVWVSFNPKLVTDFIYQRFIVNPPPSTRTRLINHDKNEFLSDTAKKVIAAKRAEDEDEYQHVYMGVPLTDDESAIIKRSWLEAAVDADIKLELDLYGARSVGYDVADSGEDKNATAGFNGAVCVDIDEWKAPEDELNQSTKRAWAKVAGGRLIYDSIGVGAHVGSTLKDMGVKAGYCKFNAGGAVINQNYEYAPGIKNAEKFENLKAQAWQDVADRLRNTYNAVMKGMTYQPSDLISLRGDLPHLHRLMAELATPRKSYSKRGLDMLETKDQLSKRGISSPNLADAFVMGACPHLADSGKIATGTIKFAM